jgi:hypothetical protein
MAKRRTGLGYGPQQHAAHANHLVDVYERATTRANSLAKKGDCAAALKESLHAAQIWGQIYAHAQPARSTPSSRNRLKVDVPSVLTPTNDLAYTLKRCRR